MQDREGRLIEVRKLVALDITLHGSLFIMMEFGLSTPIIVVFGLWLMLASSVFILGLYVFLTGLNYLPLLIYAVVIVRGGTAKNEVEYGLTHYEHYNRKYSIHQFLIFVPLFVLLLAIIQELKRPKQPSQGGKST